MVNRIDQYIAYLVITIALLFSNSARATHIIGGEMYYTNMGNDNYEITLKIYRDCYNGIPWFDLPADLKIFDGFGNLLQIRSLTAFTWSDLEPQLDSLCIVVPPDVCVQEGIYTEMVYLPPIPGGYQLSYNRCCRNSTILNIHGPDTSGITVYASIPDTSVVDTNSSPQFVNFPPILVCANEELVVDHSAIDIDGDSIKYELCTPFHGGSNSNVFGSSPVQVPPFSGVQWAAPFSETDPLGGIPLSIDDAGLLTGTPTTLGQFVVGVCANEYRDGQLLSINRRDFQFNVSSCQPVPSAAIPANMLLCADTNTVVDFDVSAISNALTFRWDFGDTTTLADTSTHPTPSYQYPDTGRYSIMLVVNEGFSCEDTGYADVYIQPGTESKFTFTDTCYPGGTFLESQSVTFSDTLHTLQWILEPGVFDTAQSLYYTFPQFGTYPVTLITTNEYNCPDTLVQDVHIYENPNANFSHGFACSGQSIQFADSTILQGSSLTANGWDLGDGFTTGGLLTVNHVYNNPGDYTVSYIAVGEGGCTGTVSKVVHIGEKPVPDFNIIPGCTGEPVILDDQSTSANPIVDIRWYEPVTQDTAIGSQASFIFNNSGQYNVQLFVETDEGCKDSISKAITVFHDPVAEFTHSGACVGDSTQFTNQATVQGGSISSYNWLFDSNGNSPSPNPYFSFTQPGTHDVTLIIQSSDGCVDTISKQIEVFYLPEAGFVLDDVCLNQSALFTDTSSVFQANIESVAWDFGDGQIDTGKTISHLYAQTGIYDVQLFVSSDSGCTATLSKQINVYDLPTADFNFSNPCSGDASLFIDNSISSDSIIKWNWNANDGFADSIRNTTHTFSSYGIYEMDLVVQTTNGCLDTTNKTVLVYPTPTSNYDFISDCQSNNVQFTDFSSIESGSIANWNWDFGDGQTGTDPNHFYTYSSKGSFTVQLAVESDFGCVDTMVKIVHNLQEPKAEIQFSQVKGCDPLTVDISPKEPNDAMDYYWEVTNGTTTLEDSLQIVFEDPGVYGVKLGVTNLEGCTDTLDLRTAITVFESVIADFDHNPEEGTVYEPQIQFINNSSNTSNSAWNFGDSTFSSQTNPNHTYQDTGYFTVQLVAGTSFGCSDTITKDVRINGNTYQFHIPNAFTPTGNGSNDIFKGKGFGIDKFHFFIFNRWGEQIFETEDKNQGWDGRVNGTMAPQGTYVYLIKITDVLGRDHRIKGHVTLLR